MSNVWDPNVGPRPNLARLPPLERERLNQPMPLRPTETYATVHIMDTLLLNQPNARINVALYRAQPGAVGLTQDGVQIDINDFTGRKPTAAIIMAKDRFKTVLAGMLRVYRNLGGDMDALVREAVQEVRGSTSAIYIEEVNRE